MKSELLNAGYRLIPLVDKQKRPRDNNWGRNSYSVDDLKQQIGLVIEPGMVDIDLDWPEMRAIMSEGSFDTLVWGRHGKATHFVYRCAIDAPVTFKLPSVFGAPGEQDGFGNSTRRTDWSKPVRAGDVVDLVNALNIDVDFGFKDERKVMATFLKRYRSRVFVFEADTGRNVALTLTMRTDSRGTYWLSDVSAYGSK